MRTFAKIKNDVRLMSIYCITFDMPNKTYDYEMDNSFYIKEIEKESTQSINPITETDFWGVERVLGYTFEATIFIPHNLSSVGNDNYNDIYHLLDSVKNVPKVRTTADENYLFIELKLYGDINANGEMNIRLHNHLDNISVIWSEEQTEYRPRIKIQIRAILKNIIDRI